MTAWGFILFIIGYLSVNLFKPDPIALDRRDFGTLIWLTGAALFISGIAQFLWEHMP